MKVTTEEYKSLSSRTIPDNDDISLNKKEIKIVWCAAKLAGEAGEFLEYVTRATFHRHDIDREKVIEELGDIMFFFSAMCTTMNISIEEIMETNANKLNQRYPNGYDNEIASKEFVDPLRR